MRRFAPLFFVVAFVASLTARAEPPLRTPKHWAVEPTLPVPQTIDVYASTVKTLEAIVRDRPVWQRDDFLVTLLHDDEYLTITNGRLSAVAPGAFFFVGPAGFGSATMFALRVPF